MFRETSLIGLIMSSVRFYPFPLLDVFRWMKANLFALGFQTTSIWSRVCQ